MMPGILTSTDEGCRQVAFCENLMANTLGTTCYISPIPLLNSLLQVFSRSRVFHPMLAFLNIVLDYLYGRMVSRKLSFGNLKRLFELTQRVLVLAPFKQNR